MARPRNKNSKRPPLGLAGFSADEIEQIQTYLKRKGILFESFKRSLIRGFLKSGKIGELILLFFLLSCTAPVEQSSNPVEQEIKSLEKDNKKLQAKIILQSRDNGAIMFELSMLQFLSSSNLRGDMTLREIDDSVRARYQKKCACNLP